MLLSFTCDLRSSHGVSQPETERLINGCAHRNKRKQFGGLLICPAGFFAVCELFLPFFPYALEEA